MLITFFEKHCAIVTVIWLASVQRMLTTIISRAGSSICCWIEIVPMLSRIQDQSQTQRGIKSVYCASGSCLPCQSLIKKEEKECSVRLALSVTTVDVCSCRHL